MPFENREDMDLAPRHTVNQAVSPDDHFPDVIPAELWDHRPGSRKLANLPRPGAQPIHPPPRRFWPIRCDVTSNLE
ncbi:MAG: hypothetical protein NTW86_20310 [Candidatus Sumerlaeota bacterium]|nr:hypothetical protein [Candidatus Sumerlaeota bacterium]